MLRAYGSASLIALVALVAFETGCTVVTSCPTGTGNPPSGGGASNGGSGNNGGGATAGTSGFGSTGVPLADWTNVTSNLSGLASECGNLSFVAAKPDEDLLIAGVALKGLWSSIDAGQTWNELGTGAKSDMVINRTSAIVFDPDHPEQFWESGLYGGIGVFKTTDNGKTLLGLGEIRHSDLVAVDFSDPDRQTLLSGGHEQPKTLNLTTDGGKTWANIGAPLPDKTNCTRPMIIDSATFLVGCGGYGGGVTGIFRSTDQGVTWDSVSDLGGASTPLRATDGSIYWSTPGTGVLARSTDDGQTWAAASASGLLRELSPIELPDGRIATLAQDAEGIVVSADQGASWQLATPTLPFLDGQGLTYSTQQKAFYLWHFSCTDNVPDDAIARSEFDYEAM